MDAASSPTVSDTGCGCLKRLSQRASTYRDFCAEIDALSEHDLIRRLLELDERRHRLRAKREMLRVLVDTAEAPSAGDRGGEVS